MNSHLIQANGCFVTEPSVAAGNHHEFVPKIIYLPFGKQSEDDHCC